MSLAKKPTASLYCHLLVERKKMTRLRMQAYKLHRGIFYDRTRGFTTDHFQKGDREYHAGYLVYRTISNQIKRSYKDHLKPIVKELKITNHWDSAWGVRGFTGDYIPSIWSHQYEDQQAHYILDCTILGEEIHRPFNDLIEEQVEMVDALKKLIEPKRKLILNNYKKQMEKEYGRV